MIYFTGNTTAKIDDKGRYPIPAKIRKKLFDAGFHLVYLRKSRHEPCLVIYTPEAWEYEIHKLREKMSHFEDMQEGSQNYNQVMREFCEKADDCAIDALGRISTTNKIIDNPLKGAKDIVFIGVEHLIEIWSKETYDELLGNNSENAERLNVLLG